MAEDGVIHVPETKEKMHFLVFFRDLRLLFKMDALGSEILRIAFPATLALVADPVASLIDTTFIGHLGTVEIAAVGVSIAILNQALRITVSPLVSMTTSFVAEEDAIARLAKEVQKKNNEIPKVKAEDVIAADTMEKGSPATESEYKEVKEDNAIQTNSKVQNVDSTTKPMVNQAITREKRHIPSASTSLVMGLVVGILQTIFLISLAKPLLKIMGVRSESPMLEPAISYLRIRSLGIPAMLLYLAMQGVFRGFKDTTTPLYAIVAGDLANVILDPILIFVCRMGVSGAAVAHVLSQYLILVILLCKLMQQVYIIPPSYKSMQFSRFLKNGFYLLGRVIVATSCATLATSLAARLGSTPMAAFQICLQVWMTSSLLAFGLAGGGQAIIACALAEKDYQKAASAASRVLQMAFVLSLGLALVVGLGLQYGSVVFTRDKHVLRIITIAIPFVAATQPINNLAFAFDGLYYGASDFLYSTYSMVIAVILSIASLLLLAKSNGFAGIWLALSIFMSLRVFAGVLRIGTGTGPWRFLRSL
ncbi:protein DETOXIFICATION 43 [Daucus carota subsp. sativus]|uniref:protein DETOXIFICATION 43 n=1 Tax=Daucus carota subsp. sativus TaxID=79200 RepID=UPI0007EF32E2|nr:PREDICTED: protein DETOXIFICATION 43-like [Daucus carota subsp. sativus]